MNLYNIPLWILKLCGSPVWHLLNSSYLNSHFLQLGDYELYVIHINNYKPMIFIR